MKYVLLFILKFNEWVRMFIFRPGGKSSRAGKSYTQWKRLETNIILKKRHYIAVCLFVYLFICYIEREKNNYHKNKNKKKKMNEKKHHKSLFQTKKNRFQILLTRTVKQNAMPMLIFKILTKLFSHFTIIYDTFRY